MTDLETRYASAMWIFIMNPEVRRAFEIRSAFISHIRRCLDSGATSRSKPPY